MKNLIKTFKKFSLPNGRAISLRHHQNPYKRQDAGISSNSFKKISEAYIIDVKDHYTFTNAFISKTNELFKPQVSLEQSLLKYAYSKTVMNTRTVAYQQTYLGIPVWRGGMNIRMYKDKRSIISSSSTVHKNVRLPYLELDEKNISAKKNDAILKSLRPAMLKFEKEIPTLIEQHAEKNKSKFVKIDKQHLVIYRYDESERLDNEHAGLRANHKIGSPFLNLESVKGIEDGSHRLCLEVFFALEMPTFGEVNWRFIIDLATRDILYARAAYHNLDGLVFKDDPVRQTGDTTLTATASAANLNPSRSSEPLLRLNAPGGGAEQALDGDFITISDFEGPSVAPPTEPLGDDFDYTSTSDDFAAVNAYYHLDRLYQMVEDFGFTISNYFAGTTFPIPVDVRSNTPNAAHSGNDAAAATISFKYSQIGNVNHATDRAVNIHEFAHSCLQNNIGDGVFSWCHNFGDAMGVVLCDPASQAPDRFLRSPYLNAGAGLRRHDRDPAAGWAWGGTFDTAGFQRRRQILSTSVFRAYRSTGGDEISSNAARQLARREFAARYLSFLMIGAVGSMTAASPPASAQDFAIAIMDFDQTNADFEGHPGGAFHKVIRWAFEKQGAFKIASDVADGPGSPPEVDVYIDDGRNGEYEWRQNFWNTTDIWSAQVNDSTVGHQTPLVGVTNYFFVKIKNRGQSPAENIVVKAHQCRPSTGLVWPVDWIPMDTPELPGGTLAPGAEMVVGPFEWTPTNVGHECILASVTADGDESNADTVNGDIPHWRLVPFDNNIAQRNVSPELPDADGLIASLTNRSFWVNNPYDRVVDIELDVSLPDVLKKLGWAIKFNNVNANRFTLSARADKKVTFNLIPGQKFDKSDLSPQGEPIDINTLINHMAVGGMTYLIDPNLKERLPELPDESEECLPEFKHIVKCLKAKDQKVDSVRVKSIIIEIKMEDKC